MRRPVLIPIAFLFLLLLAGGVSADSPGPTPALTATETPTPTPEPDCTLAPASTSGATPTPPPAATPTPTAEPLFTPVPVTSPESAASLTINSILTHAIQPENVGSDFIMMDITIENISLERTISPGGFRFRALDGENFVHWPMFHGIGADSLHPNEKVKGSMTFDVPEGSQLTQLIWETPDAPEIRIPLPAPQSAGPD